MEEMCKIIAARAFCTERGIISNRDLVNFARVYYIYNIDSRR